MDIKRIDTYEDGRFSKKALLQHGCFLADGRPYEVEIISDCAAVVRGEDKGAYERIIDEFRFYAPHITEFYDNEMCAVRKFPRAKYLRLRLDQIQPSQFCVDSEKVKAISMFIAAPDDIVIQVIAHEGRYISLDGHTRLYYAVMKGWEQVRAVEEASDEWAFKFADEARKRGVRTPSDMEPVSHSEYEEKWNRFCDVFLAQDVEGQNGDQEIYKGSDR